MTDPALVRPAGGSGSVDQAAKEEVDGRSIYVGNVDYAATPEELQARRQKLPDLDRTSHTRSLHRVLSIVCASCSALGGLNDYTSYLLSPQMHFQTCGTVNRVTILTDKGGNPKGFAYLEFLEVRDCLLMT